MIFSSEAELTHWARQAHRLWLFLDYDGTLDELAPMPGYCEHNPEVTGLLEGLARDVHKRVAIISGR